MKTKDLLFIVLFLFSVVTGFSQVAINTTGLAAEECAILDLSSGNKGLLIPRMDITEVDNVSSPVDNPVDGLLIYNQLDSPEIPVGFYYWSDSKWNLIMGETNEIIQNIFTDMYQAAELYENNNLGSPSTISLISSSAYYPWVEAIQGEIFGSMTTYINITASDPATITAGEAGLYKVEFCTSYSGTNNSQIEAAIFTTPNGSSVATKTRVRLLEKLLASGDIASGAASGLIELEAGDAVDLRFRSSSSGESLEIYVVNLIVNKVGEITP